MSAIPLILMTGLGLLVFYALHTSERYRAGAIRTLAIRNGLHYLGDGLPKSLELEGAPFHRFHSRSLCHRLIEQTSNSRRNIDY